MAHGENAPLNITPGAIRFNTDSMKLEYFRIGMEGGSTSSYAGIGTLTAGEWVQITTDTPDIQTGGTRGLFMGGGPSATNTVDSISVDTTGNATDFSNLTQARWTGGSAASRTRAVHAGGEKASPTAIVNTMDFASFSINNDFIDFGDLATAVGQGVGGASSSTRGVFLGGGTPSKSDVIQYITIASTGDAQDFGDLPYSADAQIEGTCGSPIRGIAAGGNPGPSKIDNISYITLTTLGNAQDFGDLTLARGTAGSGSNATRGLFAGGEPNTDIIDFITIQTLGNAQDFGDLQTSSFSRAGVSSPTRACFGGGGSPSLINTIDYVQIPSKGDAIDFGDLTRSNRGMASCSNGHGGLG